MVSTREINLIGRTVSVSPELEKFRAFFRKTIPVVLISYTLVLTGVLAFSYYINSKLTVIQDSITSETAQIAGLSKNEGLYLILKQKAKALTEIFQTQIPYRELYEFFESYKSEKVTISGINFGENGSIVLQILIADSGELDAFINKLLQNAQAKFSKIDLSEVVRTAENKYQISLSFQSKPKI